MTKSDVSRIRDRNVSMSPAAFRSRLCLGLCAALVLALGGCSIDRTDLSAVKIDASREAVERVLGKPVNSVKTEAGRRDTYGYNKGWTSDVSDADISAFTSGCEFGGCGLMVPIWAIVAGVAYADVYNDQRAYLTLTFGPDDTVTDRQWGRGPAVKRDEHQIGRYTDHPVFDARGIRHGIP